VSINSGTGVLTVVQGTFFPAKVFTVRATNPVGVTNDRPITITTPAVPTVTSLVVSPQVLEVSLGPKTIQFTQSTPDVGTVTWSYSPTTSGVTIDSNGLLTIAQSTYFAATTFTVTATNSVSKTGTMPMNITTPAPPVIDTVSPVSGQNVDASPLGGYAFPAFTNTASLTGTLAWSYTTTRAGVTIDASTGILTIAQGTYFTSTTFTIRVVNPVGIANTRSFTVTTPTPPTITGPTSTGTVVAGAGTGGIPRVYVNNTVTSKTVTISQGATNTGTITWSGITSLPTGVTKTTETNAALTFTVGTLAVLRPAASAFARTNNATNPAGKAATAISYDVFTPQAPVLGTPSPAPVGGTIILDTSAAQKTITIAQTVAAANTDPITWTYPALGTGITIATSNTQLVATFNVGVTVVPATSVTISAANRAGMASADVTFSIYAPALPIINSVADQYLNTTTTAQPFSVKQTVISASNQITWTTSPNAATLLLSGITYSVVATTAGTVGGLDFSVAKDQQITSGLGITVTAKNGADATASRSFTVYAGNPPSLSNPGTLFLDTTSAKTITVTNNGGTTPALTWNTPAYPTGASTSSTSNTQFIIAVAVNSNFAASSITVTGGNSIGSSSSTFSVTASVKPVLGSPSATGVIDTGAAATVTIAQTKATSTGIVWSVSPAFPAGITGSGTDSTYTITLAKNTAVAAANYVVTATTYTTATSTASFSLGGAVKPVVTTIPDYAADTRNGNPNFFTATVTDPTHMTGLTWSIDGPAVSVLNNIYINSGTGEVGYSKDCQTNDVYTITATNGYGQSGSKTCTIKLGYAPLFTSGSSTVNLNVRASTTFTSASLYSGTSGTITWSIDNPPLLQGVVPLVTINSSGVMTVLNNALVAQVSFTVRATNYVGTATTSVVFRSYAQFTSIGGASFLPDNTPSPVNINYIVVGGGGKGGNNVVNGGGGGGGGGGRVLTGTYYWTGLQTFNATVPNSGGTAVLGTGASTFASAGPGNAGSNASGGTGGSGGTSGNGKSGGAGSGRNGGGGGGDTGNGTSGTTGYGGSGSNTTFGYFGGGGGGSGAATSGPGGNGGGGTGGNTTTPTGDAGAPNTGGGGGGATGYSGISRVGASGGSGIIILYI
jgi:hypothetical protein